MTRLREKASTFAKVCMKSKRGSTTGKVLCMNGEAESEQSNEEKSNLYLTESVRAVGQTKGRKWFVTLKLHNKSQRCQLDSGATCTIMTLKDKKSLHPKQSSDKAMPASGCTQARS